MLTRPLGLPSFRQTGQTSPTHPVYGALHITSVQFEPLHPPAWSPRRLRQQRWCQSAAIRQHLRQHSTRGTGAEQSSTLCLQEQRTNEDPVACSGDEDIRERDCVDDDDNLPGCYRSDVNSEWGGSRHLLVSHMYAPVFLFDLSSAEAERDADAEVSRRYR
ncbi:unnamed protein product [Protopolystoma xenopodis]|uniref:Uncharacterized protein n=1 Tax=Protopolystoma xenopodis TaxID=117903 RepID=A0A3S4ZIY3_9PLAT|nr:unnamed protein product [Protopolystoma xenopodis]